MLVYFSYKVTQPVSPAGDMHAVTLQCSIFTYLVIIRDICVPLTDTGDTCQVTVPKGAEMRNVDTEADGIERLAEFAARDRDAVADAEQARRNRDFTQVYVKGWRRLQTLIKDHPSAARVYAFLAEHVDGTCGVVVCSQEVMASELGVHKRTIIRLTADLVKLGAIVRIRVGTGTYAYALDPTEVWKSWNDRKDTAAFYTKTLVRTSDRENGQVKRRLKVMMGEPETH